jgi:hypothetical protein
MGLLNWLWPMKPVVANRRKGRQASDDALGESLGDLAADDIVEFFGDCGGLSSLDHGSSDSGGSDGGGCSSD